MAELITLPSFQDARGALTVLERCLPFDIKRLYWIHDVVEDVSRGGHAHKATKQAMIALSGSCDVLVKNAQGEKIYNMNIPSKALILEPEDWHEMYEFKPATVLLMLASHHYDPDDYIEDAPCL